MLPNTPKNVIEDLAIAQFLKILKNEKICDTLVINRTKMNYREMLDQASMLEQLHDISKSKQTQNYFFELFESKYLPFKTK